MQYYIFAIKSYVVYIFSLLSLFSLKMFMIVVHVMMIDEIKITILSIKYMLINLLYGTKRRKIFI